MAFMTNREFAELEFRRQKRNEYADALIKEVRRLRDENEMLRAERDELAKSIRIVSQPIETIQPRGIIE